MYIYICILYIFIYLFKNSEQLRKIQRAMRPPRLCALRMSHRDSSLSHGFSVGQHPGARDARWPGHHW